MKLQYRKLNLSLFNYHKIKVIIKIINKLKLFTNYIYIYIDTHAHTHKM